MKMAGVHHVKVNEGQMEEAIEMQWGSGLEGKELDRARAYVQDHFTNLYLIEIESDKTISTDFEWGEVTQEVQGVPRENWQAPYDERQLDETGKRWAFFFHFLDLRLPLTTPEGNLILPEPTPMPEYLAHIQYELP
jgi:hypothetical protein